MIQQLWYVSMTLGTVYPMSDTGSFGFLVLLVERIHMHHNMLDGRIFRLQRQMDVLGYLVTPVHRYLTVDGDLQIDIDAVAEHPGVEYIDRPDAFDLLDGFLHAFRSLTIARCVNGLVDAVQYDLYRHLGDEQTYHDACHGVHYREAHHGQSDTDQCSDGCQCIRSVVPCIRLEGIALEDLRIMHGVVEHQFLDDDGDNGSDDRDRLRCDILI